MMNHREPLDDVPPPPYSETDIYSSSSAPRDAYAADDASRSTTSTSAGDVIYTPPLTPRSSHLSNFAGEVDNVAPSAAAAYFETRPAPPLSHLPLLVQTITITPSSTPDSLPYLPELAARDVRVEDWLTFVNYLLPHHAALTNEQVIDRKLRAEAAMTTTSVTPEGEKSPVDPTSPNNNAGQSPLISTITHAEAQLNRIRSPSSTDGSLPPSGPDRRHVETTVREWNDGFFAPRRISIRVDVEALEGFDATVPPSRSRSAPVGLTTLPPEPVQDGTGNPPMPGGWDAAFDAERDQQQQQQDQARSDNNNNNTNTNNQPRRGFGSFFPSFTGGRGGGNTGRGRGGGFRFAGINIEPERVSIGNDAIVADGRTGSVKIGAFTADPTGIKINGHTLWGPPPGVSTSPGGGSGHCGSWGRGGWHARGGGPWGASVRGGFWNGSGLRSNTAGGHHHGHHGWGGYGYGHGCGQRGGWGWGSCSAGASGAATGGCEEGQTTQDRGEGPSDQQPRGRSPHREGDTPSAARRHRSSSTSSTSSSSSSLSSSSTSSASSLDSEFSDLLDSQLPLAKERLLLWLSRPDLPVTKDQAKQFRADLRAAAADGKALHKIVPPELITPELIAALRQEVKSLAKSWKITRKEHRRARRQLKRDMRRAKKAEKKELRRVKREMKRAEREAKRAEREARREMRRGLGGPPPPPAAPHSPHSPHSPPPPHPPPFGFPPYGPPPPPHSPHAPPPPGQSSWPPMPPFPPRPPNPADLVQPLLNLWNRSTNNNRQAGTSPAASEDPNAQPPAYSRGWGPSSSDYHQPHDPYASSQAKYRLAEEAEARVIEKEAELERLHEAIALAAETGTGQGSSSNGKAAASGGVLKLEAEAQAVERELAELVKEMERLRTEADEEFAKELAREEERALREVERGGY